MFSKSFVNKKGLTRYMQYMTSEEYIVHSGDNGGFCVACGEEAYGVEPDARGYECESCGEPKVYGSEELMMMGFIRIEEAKE